MMRRYCQCPEAHQHLHLRRIFYSPRLLDLFLIKIWRQSSKIIDFRVYRHGFP